MTGAGGGQTLVSGEGVVWIQSDPDLSAKLIRLGLLPGIDQAKGDTTQFFSRDFTAARRFQVINEVAGSPSPVTFDISEWVSVVASYLDRLGDQTATVIINRSLSEDGPQDNFAEYKRCDVLTFCRITNISEANTVARQPDDNTMTEATFSFSARARFTIFKLIGARQSTAEVNALNDIKFLPDANFNSTAGVIACDAVAAGTANVLITADGGQDNWPATAADPFVADENIVSIAYFPVSGGVSRILCVRDADVAAAVEVAYSDDDGATWTPVVLGGAVGDGALGANSLFFLDYSHIWLVTEGGYIYFSADGGASWTTQDAGVTTTEDLWFVNFCDSKNGIAGGTTGAVLKTNDGGITWELVTAPQAADTMQCGWIVNPDVFWVGADVTAGTTNLYISRDGGDSWSGRTYSGSGAGQVNKIESIDIDGQLLAMVVDDGTPSGTIYRSRDAGVTWETEDTPTNSGLNSFSWSKTNEIFAVGEVDSGTGMIVKAFDAQPS